MIMIIIINGNIPTVLWHCWLGGRKGIRPVNNLSPAVPKGSFLVDLTCDSDTTFKVKCELVADVCQHAGTGATWQINAKILSSCWGGGILCHHALEMW